MKIPASLVLLLGGSNAALSLPTENCPPVSLDATTNVWKSYTLAINPAYRAKVLAAADRIKDEELQKQARKVADVGTFFWVDNITAVSTLEKAVSDIPCNSIFGIVLQGLNTGADCATPGFRKIDPDTYQKEFVDPLAKIIKSHPTSAFALLIEPYTLPAIIANSSLLPCQNLSQTYYRPLVTHALQTLGSLPNLVIYLDAGHGGNLGFDYNMRPAAEDLSAVYVSANRPSQVRGIAVNTNGYNSWDMSPGEFSTTREGTRNYALNEKQYIQRLTAQIKKLGLPVPYHAIADMSRAGVHGLRERWENWCNVNGAGFGRRPGTDDLGLDPDLIDAIVWVKNGGVSDGASEPRLAAEEDRYGAYNEFCGRVDAYRPAPRRGEWMQGYFEELIRYARPDFCERSDCWW
ncbi:putative exoglucanase 3 precursor [Rhypophila decipiens]|uniref:Glucanase n=1 Tax=Rhypophila decipiens TaxID=261697 RepID=A0AAN7B318_9PEZI|nr:putative exoglucanase 3 precursor [Rhypophila decipiens]